jgi:hypothetical protein
MNPPHAVPPEHLRGVVPAISDGMVELPKELYGRGAHPGGVRVRPQPRTQLKQRASRRGCGHLSREGEASAAVMSFVLLFTPVPAAHTRSDCSPKWECVLCVTSVTPLASEAAALI